MPHYTENTRQDKEKAENFEYWQNSEKCTKPITQTQGVYRIGQECLGYKKALEVSAKSPVI